MNAVSNELSGDVAIVTGAGVNTGAVIARTLAMAGAAVVINYRNAVVGAQAMVKEILDAGGQAVAVQGDVTCQGDVRRVVETAVATFGAPSILVNNANIRSFRDLMDITVEEWRATLAPTLDGAFFCVQACVPHMRALGRGTIINIGGGSGHSGRPQRAHVAAAKAGLLGLSKTIARELASRGITCNVVAPGFISTDMTEVLPDKIKAAVTTQIPLARFGKPEDIATAVAFLASAEAAYITGQCLTVDGGMVM